jgi:hypothetical protein
MLKLLKHAPTTGDLRQVCTCLLVQGDLLLVTCLLSSMEVYYSKQLIYSLFALHGHLTRVPKWESTINMLSHVHFEI